MSETSREPSFICRIRVRSDRRVSAVSVAEKSRSRIAAMSSSKAEACSGSRTSWEKAENVLPSSEDSMRSTPRKTSFSTWDWESSAARIEIRSSWLSSSKRARTRAKSAGRPCACWRISLTRSFARRRSRTIERGHRDGRGRSRHRCGRVLLAGIPVGGSCPGQCRWPAAAPIGRG